MTLKEFQSVSAGEKEKNRRFLQICILQMSLIFGLRLID